MSDNQVAVVGAGITGLVIAHSLQKKGIKTELFEKKDEPGGSIKSVTQKNWLVEYGPNTLLLKDKSVEDYLLELGLHVNKVVANPKAAKRYIVKDGVLQPLPGSVSAAIGTELFSMKGKMRVLKEPFISRTQHHDETVASFVERRLGAEILDYAVNPFVAGIFANNPEQLSLRHAFPAMYDLEKRFGSLIWGTIAGVVKRKKSGRIPRELISFREGLQQLPAKIAARLGHIHYGREVVKIAKEKGEWYLATSRQTYGPYKKVVLNSPLYMLNEPLFPVSHEQLQILQCVHYPPLSVLHLGFTIEEIAHPLDGFGFLVPEKEERNILGALFMSTLFNGRAPDGHHLLTVFVGGGRQPDLAEQPTQALIDMVLQELGELIGAKGEPVFIDHVYWPKSIPGYHPGYDKILQAIEQVETQNSGLYLAGNFRNGISVPDCIKNGIDLSDRILMEM